VSPNKKFDLIAFDWDGTLMDSTAHIVASIQAACVDLNLPVPSHEQASHVIGLGLADALRRAVPSILPDQIPLLVERYRSHYLAQDEQLVLFSGVREMLLDLKQRGYWLAVATGKSRLGLDRVLQATGLVELFDASRCADETHSKPHPAMLLQLMQQLGVDSRRTLMVGDTTHDLWMAANAQAHGLGVTYGAHLPEHLNEAPALDIIGSVVSLHRWFLQHG
jgi:phosphoglycolate phosphatase